MKEPKSTVILYERVSVRQVLVTKPYATFQIWLTLYSAPLEFILI